MLYDPRYHTLRQELVSARLEAGLTQVMLAKQLRRAQSYVSKIETGDGYLDVLDFLTWCEMTRADPCRILQQVKAARVDAPWNDEASGTP